MSKIVHDPQGIISSWNDSLNFWEWHGVTCSSKHQRVTSIALKSSGLVGFLSPFLGNLSFLRELELSNNTFQDTIPPEVGRLFRSEILSLTNNSIKGEIPANLSGCSNLYSYGILLLEMFTGKRPTDNIFKDEFNLHNFAKKVIPQQVMEVLDPRLLLQEEEEGSNNLTGNQRDEVEQCLVSIFKIGVACSASQPRDRMNMREVTRGLHRIRETFLAVSSHDEVQDSAL